MRWYTSFKVQSNKVQSNHYNGNPRDLRNLANQDRWPLNTGSLKILSTGGRLIHIAGSLKLLTGHSLMLISMAYPTKTLNARKLYESQLKGIFFHWWYGTVCWQIADIWKASKILNGWLSADSSFVCVISHFFLKHLSGPES